MSYSKLSMKWKVLFIMIVISTVAVIQFAMMAYSEAMYIKQSKKTFAKTLGESFIDKIDRNLFERYGDAQAFALSESARSMNYLRLRDFMNDMMPTYAPIYDVMMVVGLDGKVIAANTIDKAGKPLDTSSLLGTDYSSTAWFKAAISGEIKPGSTFVEDMHVDLDVAAITKTSGRVLNFTAPIRDKVSGKLLGIWTNRASWDDVVEQIASEEFSKYVEHGKKKVFAQIVSGKSGMYLMHPSRDVVLKDKDPEALELSEELKAGPVVHIETYDESYLQGEVYEAIVLSKGYSTYPSQGWYVKVAVDASDENIFWMKVQIVAGFLIQLAGLLLAWWLVTGMTRRLDESMRLLTSESDEVRNAATSITQGAQNLASASTEQASALQETASSVEEMNAMVKKSSENALRSREVAVASSQAANRGKDAVDQMTRAINEINVANDRIMKQVEESNRQITEIVKVITEIGNKTKVINDIVFQTKLLSFNASVEAARAGEHGKGFAVVAEEVGNLAQMSGNAAKEIAEMLNGSISKVEGIVSETKTRVERLIAEGKSKVEAGTQVAKQCGEILEEVVTNVDQVNHMIGEISTASQEQSTGINEITRAMNQLDQVTHENATTSQEAASSAEHLSKQADEMMRIIRMLKEVVEGPKDRAEMVASELRRAVPTAAPSPRVEASIKPFNTNEASRPAPVHAMKGPALKAMGSDLVPSEDDPRFQDF